MKMPGCRCVPVALTLVTLLACGISCEDARRGQTLGSADVDAARAQVPEGCMTELVQPPSEGAAHTTTCAPLTFASNPPASGTHYGSWPVFRAYDKPVPWGFLVHGLEHGAVVLAYNCPEGCAEDVAALKALMESAPRRDCGRAPVIVTPDPGLPVRFAAAAWGNVLRASCFDRATFAAFVTAHMNRGPEFFPNDCGVTDLEAQGWCP